MIESSTETRSSLFDSLAAGEPVVCPTARAADTLRTAYELDRFAGGAMAWLAADVAPLDVWTRRAWARLGEARALIGTPHPMLLTAAQEQWMWERAIGQAARTDHLLRVGPTARAARRAWARMRSFGLDPAKDLDGPLGPDATAFRGWAMDFAARSAGARSGGAAGVGWIEGASLPLAVAAALTAGEIAPDPSPLACGIDDPTAPRPPTPAQRAVLAAAGARSIGAMPVSEANLARFPSNPDAPSAANAVSTRWADPEAESAAAARWARRLLDKAARQHPLVRTADLAEEMVAPGSGLRIVVAWPSIADRARLERVFGEILNPGLSGCTRDQDGLDDDPLFEVGGGIAFADIPVIRAALDWLNLTARIITVDHAPARSGRNPDSDTDSAGPVETPLADLGILLMSPFFGAALAETAARAAVDAALRTEGRPGATLADVHRTARRIDRDARRDGVARTGCPVLRAGLARLRRHLATWRRAKRGRRPARQWAEEFRRLLTMAGWAAGRDPDRAESQAVSRWDSLMDQLAGLDHVDHPDAGGEGAGMTRGAAVARLRDMASEIRFEPVRRQPAPLLLLDYESAATAGGIDHLWIAGATDDLWPPAANPDPFLPRDLQRRLAMPGASPEGELAWARRVTARLLTAAPDIVVSAPLREGDQDRRPSPLLAAVPAAEEGWAAQRLDATPTWMDAQTDTMGTAAHHAEPEQWPMAPDESRGLSGGVAVFADQAKCPARAFARHRLGARKVDPVASGPVATLRGNMAHYAMEELWTRLGGSEDLRKLANSGPGELAALAGTVARKAVSRASRGGNTGGLRRGSRLAALEVERLTALTLEWIEIERTRGGFTVEAIEQGRIIEFGGLSLKTRVDRVDRLPDGRLVVIDYKTSREVSVGEWLGDRPDAPQLPLYCVAVNKESVTTQDAGGPSGGSRVAGIAFARLRAGKVSMVGLAADPVAAAAMPGAKTVADLKDGEHDDWDSLNAGWTATLERLGRAFREGRRRIDPAKGAITCDFCEIKPLCRVAEVDAADPDDDKA